jgi:hypothetical protein
MQDIKIEIQPFHYRVSTLQMQWPWSLEDLKAELEQEDWRPYGMETAVKHDAWTGKRYKVHRPKGQRLNEIVEFFALDSTRDYVIDCLYRDKEILQINWQMYPWRMSMNSILHAEFTKDLPGFHNGLHCDMRRLIGTGMIYLVDRDDPDLASCFYANPQREDPVMIPTGHGRGWFHSNDWDTWHDGWNRTNDVRYSILLGLTLKLEHQPQASDNPVKPRLD